MSPLDKRTVLVTPARKRALLRDMVIIAAAFLLLVPLLAIHRVTDFMIFCIYVMSFDLLYGYMGRLSFGQMLYLGTGVYVSTLFSLHIHPNPLLCMLAGILGAAVVAALLGLIVARLSEAPFALTNLAFNQVGFFLIGSAFQKVTHGEDGISSGVMPWGFLDFADETVAYVFVLTCLLGTFFVLKTLTSSPYGVLIRSIKENESRVRFLGYNTFFYKWLTFVLAGAFAGLAGTLYTLYIGFVSPVFIHPLSNVEVIFATLIGGAGNLYGALAGGVVFMVLRDNLSTHIPQWEWILGLLLLGVVFYLRQGLSGFVLTACQVVRAALRPQAGGGGVGKMVQTLLYGFTIGAILYFFSIGLSITFGTMKIINFAHSMVYTLGVYFFITVLPVLNGIFPLAVLAAIAMAIPVAYVMERFVIRRLYGESLDYAMIATYAMLLIGTDAIKWFWGNTPWPVTDPIGSAVSLFGVSIPVYRVVVVGSAIALFLGLNLFFRLHIIGKIVIAALDDSEGVRCLGLNVDRYFSIVFVLGSALAVLGGVLYAPISTAEPYMGHHILLIAFAVVIVGGLGNLTGTFVSAFVLGLVMAFTGRYYSQAADTMVFVVMAAVLIFRRNKT